ncbi:MAG: cell division protein FtsZ [Gammaproteobacteria bacterium]|nr:MAG: cell division protein FtsZ [Chloroflexota bacterium]TDJ22909.1 MAG: cell division protein FtsZ [Gammaproteobacteria bacterium]TDJ38934.1 MAG: cell division protein FtsZ [Gammaproteobacteria bacterium]
MFELVDSAPQNAVIKVIGVGGGGGNAVQHMVRREVEGVDFITTNTDAQALKSLDAQTTLQIGSSITKGLGAGSNPEIGRQAALEDRDRISEVLAGADMVFITAGMGGGTGTGAAPVIAEIARECDILTVAVVTKPFRFEKRMEVAEAGIEELSRHVDSLITIPNEKLLAVLGERTSMLDAFSAANDVLLGAVQGIADLIIRPGMINVDFADVRTVMSEMGMAMMGTGRATGENRARDAAESAIRSPLLEDIDLHGARGILVNVTAGPDLSIGEFSDVGDIVDEFASEHATVVLGTVIDPELGDELRVTVVATGLGGIGRPNVIVDNTTITTTLDGDVNYRDLDRPTVLRQQSALQRERAGGSAEAPDLNYLDIPAFLRRQAD